MGSKVLVVNLEGFPEERILTPVDIDMDSLITQTFTSSGTFIVPANVYMLYATLVGGGGGGARAGGGGGSGYWYENFPVNVTPSQSISIVLGSGGTGGNATVVNGGNGGISTLGTYLSVNGGLGGKQAVPQWGYGACNGGIKAFPGGSSQRFSGGTIGNSGNCGGGGGGGYNGTGGNGGNSSGVAGGNASANSGAGGGGGYCAHTNGNGGSGGKGLCIIKYMQ